MAATIRRVQEKDLPELVVLCEAHAAYERSEFQENGQAERLRRAFFGPQPLLHGWVVVEGGRLVGFMTVTVDYATWTADHFLHMDCLYLDEEFRRQGLGRKLIEEMKKFGREKKHLPDPMADAGPQCGWHPLLREDRRPFQR